MVDLRTAEVDRITDAVASSLGGFMDMFCGIPLPEELHELAADMAEGVTMSWSAIAVMADVTQPIRSDLW